MIEPVEGELKANGYRFGLVVSKFNEFVTSRLLASALETLKQYGAVEDDMHIVRVPGAFEIPLIARRLAVSMRYHAVICLGAVIRGDTPHFDYICTETARGIAQVGLEVNVPVIFGVLTANTVEQAMERAGPPERNRGADAARSAIEMAALMAHPLLQPSSKGADASGTSRDTIDPLECW
ncbi:MAG: 6,7-dimethyl-8-ribityllumazine synthase [Nitrospirales bacterium]|nr:MAG: 6,7-dimethyl-8-ribityllumazine synthase [Nitrospirales bacterium]